MEKPGHHAGALMVDEVDGRANMIRMSESGLGAL